ncbi:aminotransferase class I/II-fold pyridoxal phosphate-dependent enzyme, partial [Porticoccaceae bacterium]|nr:aminotransferase class I/II-fold pyridoxal phosphate-dependent enzyme [Porticoccaceae bacterium]
ASFNDQDYFEKTAARVIRSREQLTEQLERLNFNVLPSAANFVFARHQQQQAEEIASQLRRRGIIVRHFKQDRIDQFLRITLGSEQQNQLLVQSLTDILG